MNTLKKINNIKIILVLACLVIMISACSKPNKESEKKNRRKASPTTRSTIVSLPSLPTTTKPLDNSKPLLTAYDIKKQWTKTTLCNLLESKHAKEILGSTVDLTPTYKFSELSGARCSYKNSTGDEIYFEISPKSYLYGRAIDAAMKRTNTPVSISNIDGVSQQSPSTGIVFHLKIWGQTSNQWSFSAPSEKQGKDMVTIVVSALE